MAAVRPIAARVASDPGLVLWDIEFAREAGSDVLRLAVDKRGGIDSDGIAKFSEAVSREIDASDAVPGDGGYVLEVTSPGADRRLRTREEFDVCAGRWARITFRTGAEPIEGQILSTTDDEVTLAGEPPASAAFADISQARLILPAASAPKRANTKPKTAAKPAPSRKKSDAARRRVGGVAS
jgi:ribosome maturation factor RimP